MPAGCRPVNLLGGQRRSQAISGPRQGQFDIAEPHLARRADVAGPVLGQQPRADGAHQPERNAARRSGAWYFHQFIGAAAGVAEEQGEPRAGILEARVVRGTQALLRSVNGGGTARAEQRSQAGRLGVTDVVVTNQRGEQVALVRGRSYRVKGKAVAP